MRRVVAYCNNVFDYDLENTAWNSRVLNRISTMFRCQVASYLAIYALTHGKSKVTGPYVIIRVSYCSCLTMNINAILLQ